MSAIYCQPIRTVKLYGQLRQFGKSYPLAVRSPAEAIKALCVQIPGFERFISNAKSKGLVFAVFLGKKNIGESELHYQGEGDIIIAPVIEGSKRGGILQTVVGVVLLAVGAVLTYASGGTATPFTSGMMMMGASLALGGVIQILSPQAGGLKTSAAPENTPGYAFGSAKNTTASGNPVPLCYGKRRVGGAIISAAIYAEDQM
ncbi:tail assembly protein [Pseudomonas sp. Fl4BN1]|uniref:tail assembly protein n=1 Tax=Pseudomonas sp. Fl4BN1 TaxID=2697651 RepID=UPI001379125E|nr:tail assembly protein [Pseudomonas sp. Fl4BN1]NBF08594.1 tail assembly protein [Pseudomonas sp. Fl4BN1]